MRLVLIELRAGGDAVVHHQEVQAFLTFLVVDGADDHAAGVDAHHGSGRQIHDGNAGFSDQFFRLVVFVDAGKNHSVSASSVIQHEFQEFFGLFDCLTRLDLDGAEVGFCERLEVDEVLEQRLDLDVRKINRLVLDLDLDCARRAADDTNFLWLFCLGSVEWLHRREQDDVADGVCAGR